MTDEEINAEYEKALLDMVFLGTGVVLIDENGDVKHIKPEDFYILPEEDEDHG